MTLKDLLSKEFNQNLQKKAYQGMSNIPLLGGASRAYRYPKEFLRQLGGIGKYGISSLSGADQEKLQQIMQEYQQPMYMNEKEFGKMTGKAGTLSPVLEGMGAGADIASWATPMGPIDDIIKASVGAKTSSKLLPWALGKIGSGAVMGPVRGLASSDASKPETVLPNMLKSAGVSAGLNLGLGALQEGAKAVKNLGNKTTARALGIGQKGDTTEKMTQKLKNAKGSEGLAVTAQGQLDKGAKKAYELTKQKIDALNRTDVSDLQKFKESIKEDFKNSISKNLNSSKLQADPIHNDMLSKIDAAQSLSDLDDMAIEARNKVESIGGQYNPEGSIEKTIYDALAGSVVNAIKGVSKGYDAAKTGLSDVLSRIGSKELINKAFKENSGMGAPLFLAGSELPIPKGLWSLIGSGVGAAERGIGALGSSDIMNKVALFGGNQLGQGIQSTGEQQESQDINGDGVVDLSEAWGDMGGMQSGNGSGQMGGAMTPGYGLGLSQGELSGSQSTQQQPAQKVDMQELAMRLMNGISSGQITSADAEMIIGLANVMQGGSLDGNSGKTLPASALGKIQEVEEAKSLLPQLEELLAGAKDAFGPVIGTVRGRNPFDTTGQSAQGTINLVKQIIGKGLEGGVLRKEDEYKYEKILPMLKDKPEVVAAKIEGLKKALDNKYLTIIETYQEGGYDPFIGRQNSVSSDYSAY